MNKNAIKKFAIDARNKLIASVTDKAGMLGITPDNCSEAITKGADFEVYKTAAGTEVTLNKKQCEQRRKLVDQIHARGFEAVVEEVAYTWFNRICAIRFMEVNDYMYPVRVRVLSSEKEGKNEPDVVTMAPEIDWDFTDKEREEIIDAKMNNRLDDLFRMLFIKQCNLLHEVLPGLFEETEDYTEMLLNISFTNEDDVIRMLVDEKRGIQEEDFNVNTIGEDGQPTGQVEIIGWLYQYYNTELKDDTFAKLKKNVKITKERIPAATQLFTPDWIVRYMVENSVGRIWIEHLRAVDSSIDEKATAERFGWKYYLPEAEQEDEVNVKLAEIRTTYKDLKPTEINCIDPCMGSGHILIAMFDVLMDIYESAGYDKREAAFDIVEHNIHGLDIDQRAYQLAYFAVMMKGRGYNRRFLSGKDGKPEPKVYAITESNEINRNHLRFFGTHLSEMERNLAVMQIEGLLDTFKDAREYGSILNVDVCDWEMLERFVDDLGTTGQISFESVGSEETQESLRKLVRVVQNLGQKYDAVVTNPPYMGASGMGAKLSKYVKDNYSDSKSDFFAVFIEKCRKLSGKNRYVAMITQPSFLFLSSYEKLRTKILNEDTILSMLHMGRGIFGIDFGSVAFCIRNRKVFSYVGRYYKLYERTFQYIDPEDIRDIFLNAKHNKNYRFDFLNYNSRDSMEERGCLNQIEYVKNQDEFEIIEGVPYAYWADKGIQKAFKQGKPLGRLTTVRNGLKTGDNNEFLRYWWEINFNNTMTDANSAEEAIRSNKKWFPYNKGGDARKWYGNEEYVINWMNGGERVIGAAKKEKRNVQDYPDSMKFVSSGTWSLISAGKPTFRLKKHSISDIAGMSFYNGNENTEYYLGFCNTELACEILQMLAPTINYQAGDIARLPIIMSNRYYEEITNLVKKCVQGAKNEWDSYETSWEFNRHPLVRHGLKNDRFIGDAYNEWDKECTERNNLVLNAETRINELFSVIYEVEDKNLGKTNVEVLLRKADKYTDIKSFVSYAVGCMFGRYSLDREGLVFAGGDIDNIYWKCQGVSPLENNGLPLDGYTGVSLAEYHYGYLRDNKEWKKATCLHYSVDYDNVIPITDEEYFSDDIVNRFIEFVKIVYSADTLEENLDFIANALGNKGDTSREVIRNYFLKDFYVDHLKVYQKRPIYWLFDSGKQNGFKALIYMHRYDADTVGRVRTDYLHKAQKYVETAMQSAQYTIDNATSTSEKSKATKAVTKYTKQLAEMKIYDEAIAHVANQRIEIDLDDGVKVNYAKFQGVEVAQEGKKALKVDLLAKI